MTQGSFAKQLSLGPDNCWCLTEVPYLLILHTQEIGKVDCVTSSMIFGQKTAVTDDLHLLTTFSDLLPPANGVAKVMFSVVSVCPQG